MPAVLVERLPARRLPFWFVATATGFFLALKLVLLLGGQVQVDEAYYWLWGRYPQLSYVDHPALHAWVQGVVTGLFGTSALSIRTLSVVTTGVTLWLLYDWCRRLAPADWRYAFALTVALFYSSPLMVFVTTMAIHDRLLLLLAMLAIHCFVLVGLAFAQHRRVALVPLYLGALCIGLAVLSKLMGVVVGLGIAAAIVWRADTRGLPRSLHLWLAVLLAVLLQLPTLVWNLQHGGLTVAFHLGGVQQVVAEGMRWEGVVRVLYPLILLLSPFCVWGIVRFVTSRSAEGFGGMLHDLGRMIFLASTVVVLFVDVVLGKESLFYWNIIAYGAFFALSAWFIRSRLLIVLHLLYGAVISTALVYHFSFFPFLDGRISQAGNLYGWDQLAAAIETEKLETGAAFVAADNWQHASQLAFAMNDPEVPAITAGADAFDQWVKPDRDVGKDAVLLVGRERNLDYLRTQFDSVEHLRHVEVTAWGTKVFSYELYLGRDYHPDAGRPF